MTLVLNGTFRKALISSSVAAIFALCAYLASDLNARIKFLESESRRVGLVAAGRGERIEKLERKVDLLETRVRDHEILLGTRPRRRVTREPEW